MTETFELQVLRRFAESALARSRVEVFGDANIAKANEAITRLRDAGYLADSGLRDGCFGIKWKVTPAGYRALGLPLPSAAPARAGVVPANGRKRRSA